jgi:hypothetical protein
MKRIGSKDTQFYMAYSVSPKKDTPREHIRMDDIGCANLKQNIVAFEGKYVVVAEADEFWGGEKSQRYQSSVLLNPTWAVLYRCAKAQQKRTKDLHHSFFEGAYVPSINNTITVGEETATVLRLSLGS